MRVLGQLRARAAEEQLGKPAEPAAADHDDVGVDLVGDREEHRDRVAVAQLRAHREPGATCARRPLVLELCPEQLVVAGGRPRSRATPLR